MWSDLRKLGTFATFFLSLKSASILSLLSVSVLATDKTNLKHYLTTQHCIQDRVCTSLLPHTSYHNFIGLYSSTEFDPHPFQFPIRICKLLAVQILPTRPFFSFSSFQGYGTPKPLYVTQNHENGEPWKWLRGTQLINFFAFTQYIHFSFSTYNYN